MVFSASVLAVVFLWVDLTPKVEAEFFFSRDDPQYVASAQVSERFPTTQQIILRVAAPDIRDAAYRERVERLAGTLSGVDGVVDVSRVANRDAFESPLWQRVLISEDQRATNLLLEVEPDTSDPGLLIEEIERVTAEFQDADFGAVISGVPYVIELIRRNLFRDLAMFSVVAAVVFAAIVAVVYRSGAIVIGTLTACVTASSLTLIITQVVGGSIGLLTANIATIVFVLTLSHIVFLTSNWRQCCDQSIGDPADAVRRAVAITAPASFWCMLTTLFGFVSLFLASAKPLRQLGMAGAIGTAAAIVVAYTVFPPFLRHVAPLSGLLRRRHSFHLPLSPGNGRRHLAVFALVGVVASLGVPRVNTDPDLLSYFTPGDPLRVGLEAVDRDGGSSPLNLVVQDAGDGRLDTNDAVERMWNLQLDLEGDSSIGGVVSPALILAEARRAPFVGRLPPAQLLDFLSNTALRGTIASYIRPDRQQGLFFLRMHEADRTEPRRAVIARIEERVRAQGLEPVLVGGLYEQQGQLGELIASSLRLGLGGLIALFLCIAFYVSRDARVTAAMVLSLAGIPLIVLGSFGHLGRAIDIISSPAANVALAMGVDSMIHLMVRARRFRTAGSSR
jgi:predicted RND superfamily exporter protein